MSLAVRSLIFIFSVVILSVAISSLGIALGWDPTFTLDTFSAWLLSHPVGIGVFGFALAILAILGLTISLRHQDEPQALVKETSLGTIRISLGAMETLVKRAAAEIEGVRAIQPTLAERDGKFDVKLALEVAPDTNIPHLADRVHTRVEEYLAQTVGINEVQVSITVREISSTLQKNRVK